MVTNQILMDKLKTRHVGLYCSLKPWEIVKKFDQKMTGLAYYYYEHLTAPSELSFYYYALKFSCLKTVSHRKKISISQILKIHGPKITMKGLIKRKDKYGEIKDIDISTSFKTYLEIMDEVGKWNVQQKKLRKQIEKDRPKFEKLIHNNLSTLTDPLNHMVF